MVDDEELDDEELDDATKRILDRTKNIRFTAGDAKRNRSGKRAQKEKISKPSLSRNISEPSLDWDKKENFWDEIKDLEAEKAIEKIQKELANVNDKKHEIDLWIKLGEKLYHIRKEEDAVAIFNAVLIRDPDNITAIKSLGWCYQRLKKFSDARDCAKKILGRNDGGVDTLLDYAWCSQKLEDWDQAREYYLKVLAMDEKIVDAQDNLGYVYFETGKYDQAINCFEGSVRLERDDDDHYAERYLARCYFMKGEDDDCEKYLDLVIKKDVTDWYIYYMKGEILVNKKLFGEAVEHYKRSINIKEQRLNVFGLGRCYVLQENWDFGILFYEKSLEISRADAAVTLGNLAVCFKRKDEPDMEKAIKLCDEALEEKSDYLNALYTKMRTLNELYRYDDVLSSATEFQQINGVDIEDREVLLEIMTSYEKLDELGHVDDMGKKMYLDLANLLAQKHNDWRANCWKAYALEDNGKLDEAEKYHDWLIEKWPEDWRVYDDKANFISRNSGKMFEQLVCYEKSLQLLEKMENKEDDDLAKIHLRIGVVIKEIANSLDLEKGLPDEGITKTEIDRKFGSSTSLDKKQLFEKALRHIDLAIKYNDNLWNAWFENGNCFWGLKNYLDAFENYMQAQKLNPTNVGIWCCLGDTALKINKSVTEAKYYFQKAISVSNKRTKDINELIENNTKVDYDWVDAQINLLECLYTEEKYEETLGKAREILSICKDRGITRAHHYLGCCLDELGRYSEAIDIYEQGIKEFPENKWFKGICLYNAGTGARNAGFELSAEEYANKLIESDCKEASDGYYLLARLFLNNQNYEEPIKILEEHFANFSEDTKRTALRDLITCCDRCDLKEKKEEYEKRLKELKEKD